MHIFEFFTVATTLNLPVLLTFRYGFQSQFEIPLSCKDVAVPFEVLANLSYLVLWYWRLISDIFLQLSVVSIRNHCCIEVTICPSSFSSSLFTFLIFYLLGNVLLRIAILWKGRESTSVKIPTAFLLSRQWLWLLHLQFCRYRRTASAQLQPTVDGGVENGSKEVSPYLHVGDDAYPVCSR